ncbi:NAD(P)H-hydrate dehydratase [Candidatus Woesearchaeota archaeon]|nr:NAD(P)H-hydrate dehydratase [Candidatus Woesearchaeota archaeon]
MTLVTAKDVKLPRRRRNAHKGEQGRLLIVGGSEDLVGAPVLAAKAAFRAGCDVVEVAAPWKVAWAINTHDASIIAHKLRCKAFSEAQVPRVLAHAKRADAVLLGNGLGRSPAQRAFVRGLLRELDKPVVIDADALHATFLDEVRSDLVVCTPHGKEYESLVKNNKAIPGRVVILKKGSTDVITQGRNHYENRTGVPEMAVAGTGDVLAGLAAGFLAQGVTPLRSAINAAYLNGKAGERAKKKYGNFSAEELLLSLRA